MKKRKKNSYQPINLMNISNNNIRSINKINSNRLTNNHNINNFFKINFNCIRDNSNHNKVNKIYLIIVKRSILNRRVRIKRFKRIMMNYQPRREKGNMNRNNWKTIILLITFMILMEANQIESINKVVTNN
jgi:hypothetical protein